MLLFHMLFVPLFCDNNDHQWTSNPSWNFSTNTTKHLKGDTWQHHMHQSKNVSPKMLASKHHRLRYSGHSCNALRSYHWMYIKYYIGIGIGQAKQTKTVWLVQPRTLVMLCWYGDTSHPITPPPSTPTPETSDKTFEICATWCILGQKLRTIKWLKQNFTRNLFLVHVETTAAQTEYDAHTCSNPSICKHFTPIVSFQLGRQAASSSQKDAAESYRLSPGRHKRV